MCDPTPAEFADFTPLVLTGSLEGCLYTDVQGFKFHEAPSRIYQEVGAELIVASLDGGPVGTFTTTYRFESKWDPDAATGMEVKGRCQHPITSGPGPAGSRGRRDGWTSRTRSAPCCSSTGDASRSAEASPTPPPFRHHDATGKPPRHHLHRVANALTCRDPLMPNDSALKFSRGDSVSH